MFWFRDKLSAAAISKDEKEAEPNLALERAAKQAEYTEKNARDAALWDESVAALAAFAPRPACPKCTDTGIDVKFDRPVFSHKSGGYAGGLFYDPVYAGEPAAARFAKLHHTCKHCGYTWDTQAADHAA